MIYYKEYKKNSIVNLERYHGWSIEAIAKENVNYLIDCIVTIPEFVLNPTLIEYYSITYRMVDEIPIKGQANKSLFYSSIDHFAAVKSKVEQKWGAYQEFLSYEKENEDCSDDHDYKDYLRDGFFEGDTDTYNEYMGY
jgi:hypothetical protein